MLKRVLIFLVCFAVGCSSCISAQLPAQQYFDLLDEGLAQSRSQMSAITASAQEAAARLVAGGNLYAAGSQENFRIEAVNRAGGVMCLKLITNNEPSKGDIVLVGIRDKLDTNDRNAIRDWKSKGVYVVAFASSKALPPEQKTLPDVLIDNCDSAGLIVQSSDGSQKLCPVDTVINVVNLWVWTGELTSACTRLGKMPILYQSYLLVGGRERAEKYRDKTFHDDMTIEPIPPGRLGDLYLDAIGGALRSFRQTNMDRLVTVAGWWRAAKTPENTKLLTIGHLFPAHFQDPRTAQLITMQEGWGYKPSQNSIEPGNFILFCGYQNANEELVTKAVADGFKLAYISVKSATPAEPADNIIYLNPYWPLTDGCVTLPDYDIPILPASGVINAAIYWALLAQYSRL